MISAPLPPDEPERLAALRALRILDTPPEETFERLARLVTTLIGVPIGVVSLVDADRQWFKAHIGLASSQTSRDIAFCAHAILDDAPLVVEDARLDPRFHDNPLVTDSPGVRFYAGAPIKTRSQRRIGVLCAIDRQPHRLAPDQAAVLQELAKTVADQLDLRLSALLLRDEQAERERAERAARESEARLQAAIKSLPFDFWIFDRDGRCIVQNAVAERHWGDARGRRFEEFGAEPALAARWQALGRRALAGELVRDEARIVEEGGFREVECLMAPVRCGEEISGLVGMNLDVTARRAAERRLADFLATASDWAWETDTRHRFTTYAGSHLSPLGPMEEVIGKTRWEVAGADPNDPLWRGHLDDLAAHRPFRGFEYRLTGRAGQPSWISISGNPIFDPQGRFLGYRGTTQDVSERKRAEARVRELAHHDTLTGLPNRRFFQDLLGRALDKPAPSGCGALFLLDLDHFKEVNDTLGHDAGDALLRQVAERLRESLRASDTVARLGGDEFSIVLQGVARPGQASEIARKILAKLAQPIEHKGHVIHTGASIGITLFPRDGSDPGQLLKNADIALYEAKARGRRQFSFFDAKMRAEIEGRRHLVEELRRAVAAEEFVLLYQPKVRLEDAGHAGFEALLRWRHPQHGLIAPQAFLPAAEESGLIVPIGQLVLRLAIEQLRAWRDAGLVPGQVAVNFAVNQLRDPSTAEEIERLLALHGIEPGALAVEITENVLLDRGSEAIGRALRRLHEIGVTIALDDFGTGYASLTHLKRFSVDCLKIDRSFVRDIGTDPEDAAISRAIVNLAHSLGLQVVAEGIETDEQLAFLRLNGCDFGQGFLFASGLPAGEAQAYLAGRRPAVVLGDDEPAAASLPRRANHAQGHG